MRKHNSSHHNPPHLLPPPPLPPTYQLHQQKASRRRGKEWSCHRKTLVWVSYCVWDVMVVCWKVILHLFLFFFLSLYLLSFLPFISTSPFVLSSLSILPASVSPSLPPSLPPSSPSQSLDYDTCYNIPFKERLRSFTKQVGRLYSLTHHTQNNCVVSAWNVMHCIGIDFQHFFFMKIQ